MQTFLPYADFKASARCLDSRRLNKQIVEAEQILTHCINNGGSWITHPAIRMWQGYEGLLVHYGRAMFEEFYRRYGNDHQSWTRMSSVALPPMTYTPWWLGHEPYHQSHRSRLWNKFPAYYKQFEADGRLDLPYFWPSKE